jgi:hypothetical protein
MKTVWRHDFVDGLLDQGRLEDARDEYAMDDHV